MSYLCKGIVYVFIGVSLFEVFCAAKIGIVFLFVVLTLFAQLKIAFFFAAWQHCWQRQERQQQQQ